MSKEKESTDIERVFDILNAKQDLGWRTDEQAAEILKLIEEEKTRAKIQAYRSVPQVDVDLEKWLWEKIDQLEAALLRKQDRVKSEHKGSQRHLITDWKNDPKYVQDLLDELYERLDNRLATLKAGGKK